MKTYHTPLMALALSTVFVVITCLVMPAAADPLDAKNFTCPVSAAPKDTPIQVYYYAIRIKPSVDGGLIGPCRLSQAEGSAFEKSLTKAIKAAGGEKAQSINSYGKNSCVIVWKLKNATHFAGSSVTPDYVTKKEKELAQNGNELVRTHVCAP